MVSQDPAISSAGLETITAVQQSAGDEMRAVFRMRVMLLTAMTASLLLTLRTAASAATITVNSLADAGAPGICVLRGAITAANTKAPTNGCAAGTGNDTIGFSVTG